MQKTYNTVMINGEPFNCHLSMSLADVLIYLDFNIENIIVEYNKTVVNHNAFDNLILQNLDKIEVITIVGGG